MNLQVTEKKVDGVERLLQVEVPADMVRQAEEKAVRRYASSARLPGFRPGKAPPAMIRQRFADAIRQEAVESLIQEAYKQVVGDSDVKLAAQPHVHDVKFSADQALPGRRGVYRCMCFWSSMRRTWPSIHPKQSDSSTASS